MTPRRRRQAGRGRWWAPLESAVAALLVVVVAAYLLAAWELFLKDGEPVTNVSSAGPGELSPFGAAAASPAAAADGSGTAPARGNPARTGEVDESGPSGSPGLLWSVQTGGEVVAEPVVADGVVYVGSGDGILYAVDAATGVVRWRFPTPGPIAGAAAVANGVVYAASRHGVLYAVDAASGLQRWRVQLVDRTDAPQPVEAAAPLVAGELVYVASAGAVALAEGRLFAAAGPPARVFAVDAATGAVRWTLQPDRAGLYALDPVGGEPFWAYAAEGVVPTTPVVRDGVVYAIAAAADGAGELVALDAASGRLLRRERATSTATTVPAATTAGLVVGAADAGGSSGAAVVALRAGAGSDGPPELWRSAVPRSDAAGAAHSVSPPTVARQSVYVGASNGLLVALDLATGQERWRVDAGTALWTPAVAGGSVFVGGQDGRLLALGSGTTPARATATPSGTTTTQLTGYWPGMPVYVIADNVILRASPGYAGDPVAVLPRSTELEVTGAAVVVADATFWPVRVDATGERGYVAAGFLTDVPPDRVQVLRTPTPSPVRFRRAQIVYVAADDIKLHAFATELSAEVATLSRGTALQIDDAILIGNGQSGFWWRVRLPADPSVVGYVRDEQVADGVSAARPTPTAAPTPAFVAGQTVYLAADGVALRPSPYPDGRRAIGWLGRGEAVVVAGGSAIVVAGEPWQRVELARDPTVGGYVPEAYLSEQPPAATVATPSAEGSDGGVTPSPVAGVPFQPGDVVVVTAADVNLRPLPALAHEPIRVLRPGDELVIAGPAVEADSLAFWPVEDASGVAGYVVGDVLQPSFTTTPTPIVQAPTPTLSVVAVASPPVGIGLEPASPEVPDLSFIELAMEVDATALAAGDEAAVAALERDLQLTLSFFQTGQTGGCRAVAVVVTIAVGTGDTPEDAIAAAVAVETALRETYDPAFAAVDVLRFADAATPPDQVRVRVYYVEACAGG